LHDGDFPVDAGYRLLAAKYVRKQAKQLRAQFDGICAAEDIEFVHRARVASRRLRAAMRIFGECFDRNQVKRWKKAIRRIRSELGEARDKDVQIELLRGILESLSDKMCFSGISRLLVQWEYQRERLQSNVVRAVSRLQRNGTLKEIENTAKRVLLKAEADESQVQSPESYAQARQEILERLNQLLLLQDCLSRPDDQQSHHAMRIAAKRLRYTMEIVRPIYSGRLDATLEAIKQVQTLLGEVHDCDVWQEQIDRFAKDERKCIKSNYGHAAPFTRLNAGIEHLRQDRIRHRQECFQNLVRLWGELDVQEVWDNMVSVVQSESEAFKDSERSQEEEKPLKSSVAAKVEGADRAEAKNDGNGDRVSEDSPALSSSNAPTSGKHAKHRHRSRRRESVIP
jgi:CHAD domain-containing protein